MNYVGLLNMVSKPTNSAGQSNTTAKIRRGLGDYILAVGAITSFNRINALPKKLELKRDSSERDNSPLTPTP